MSQHKVQLKGSSDTYYTDSPAQSRHWDDSVKKMSTMFDSSYTNPFNFEQPCEQLINFATGMLATPEVAKSLIGCIGKGDESVKQFVQERLIPHENTGEPTTSFYAPMKRSGVKTMTKLTKPVCIKSKTVNIDAEEMYFRIMRVNANKKMSPPRIHSFELAPVPLRLFRDDGFMMYTQKVTFCINWRNW